jgi:putative copper export protein
MTSLYFVSVTLHLLAAMLWLGGMFFLAVVGAPVLRRVEPASLRSELFHRLGLRFRAVGWIAIGALIVTGIANLGFLGLLDAETLGSASFWQGRYGRALAWKLAIVVAMVSLAAMHDFALGPRASRHAPGSPEAVTARRRVVWLARLNAGLGVALVAVAVRLARGG